MSTSPRQSPAPPGLTRAVTHTPTNRLHPLTIVPQLTTTPPDLPIFALAAEDDAASARGLATPATPVRPQPERIHYTTPALGSGTAAADVDPFTDPYCDASIRELWLRRQQLDLLEQLCRQEEDMLLRRHQEHQQRRASCFSVASARTDYAEPDLATTLLPPPPLLERVASCQPHASRRRAELDVEEFDQVLRLDQAGVGATRQGRRASLPLLFSAAASVSNDAAARSVYADSDAGVGADAELGDEFGLVAALYNAPVSASLLRRESAPLPFLPQTTPTMGAGALSLALAAAAATTPAQATASLAFSPPPRHARERTRSADPLLFGGTRLSLSSGGAARTLRRASVQWNAYDDDGQTDEAEELSRLYTDVSMSAMGTPTVATTFDSGLSDVGDEELSQRTAGGRKTRSGTSAAAAAAAAAAREKHPLHKTELCRSWEETGSCRYGSKCQFAHSQQELRTVKRHPKWRTKRCKTFWTEGTCPYGKRCGFIHHPDDQAPSSAVSDAAADAGSAASPMATQHQHHHQHQQQMLLPITPPPPMDTSGTLPGTPSPAPSAAAATGSYSMLATPPQLLPFVLPTPDDARAFASAAAAAARAGAPAPPMLPTPFTPDAGPLKPPPLDCGMGGAFPAGVGSGGGACAQMPRIAFDLPFDGKQPPMPYGYSHVPPAAGPLVPGQPPPHGFLVGPPPQPQPQHRQQLQLHQAHVMTQMMPPPPQHLGIGPPPFACPPPPVPMPPPPPAAAGFIPSGGHWATSG
ncbi:hypothetical protein HK405_009803 [Cladochytrium tenue]|nr:hypothetical protein HK405_009803 [Cladochytrium tenue]